MKKLLFSIVLVVCLAAFPLVVFAADGKMWGEDDIKVVQTEWFDIIYPPGSKESTALLAENADRIYREIADFFGREPKIRLPVVLSPKTEMYNAYFTNGYYNHIVLYDTVPSEGLDVDTNDLLATFRHELTHAYTLNMKNGFWLTVDKIFGDLFNPAVLFTQPGLIEGSAVLSESSTGEGRLNDEYSRQLVKQAKIEGKFPAYADIQGFRDKYPAGAYYIFNAEFNKWLVENYGMEKLAAFWYKCVNFQTVYSTFAFKSVYGISVDAAWKSFIKDFEIPKMPANPLESENLGVRDFFSGSPKKYSIKNNAGSRFSSVAESDDLIAWLDEGNSGVWIVEKSEAKEGKPRAKKLFTVSGAQKISLSRDGRYLAVSYIDQKTPTYLLRVKIHDLKKHVWSSLNGSGISDAAIVQDGDDYYVVSLGFHSQNKWINIRKIGGKGDGIDVPMGLNDLPSNFVDIGGGRFAFVRKTGLKREICIADVRGEIVLETPLPVQRMVVRNLSFDKKENIVYFSYTVPSSMPRLGAYSIGKGEFILDGNDVSGGIYCPVKLDADEFVYVGEFFTGNRLFKLDANSVFSNCVLSNGNAAAGNGESFALADVFLEEAVFSDGNRENPPVDDAAGLAELEELASDLPREEIITLSKPADDILSGAKKYNPFDYLKKGVFLPVGSVNSYYLDIRDKDNFGTTDALTSGVTYMTANPWDSNVFALSAGYSPFTNSVGLLLGASGGTDTDLFKWAVQGQTEFDFAGWKQAFFIGEMSTSIPFGNVSKIAFSDKALLFLGRGNDKLFSEEYPFFIRLFPTSTNQRDVFFAVNDASVYYSNIHKTGAGTYERAGFNLGVSFLLGKNFDMKDLGLLDYNDAQLSPFMEIRIPKLLPIDCKNFFVYNLPATLNLSFFGGTDVFANASADAILFAYDIQKAIPFFYPLFINRFYISAGYAASFSYKESAFFDITRFPDLAKDAVSGRLGYTDYVHSCFALDFTPNIGELGFKAELQFDLRYYLNPPKDFSSNWDFKFNFASDFRF